MPYSRPDEIRKLQARARRLEDAGKHKAASMIIYRLRDLMTRQIRSENQKDRKSA